MPIVPTSVTYGNLPVVELAELLDRYRALLQEVDRWFSGCVEQYEDQITCRYGCTGCCRGLFDITLLDALLLRQGVELLAAPLRGEVNRKALLRLRELHERFPPFVPPWLLNVMPEERWEELMPDEDEVPCVLLSDTGSCLAYEHRPMTCRLHGLPLIDVGGEELFDEWCTLNFTSSDPRSLAGLRFRFNDLFAQELLLFREMARQLFGSPLNELDTLIPGAVVLEVQDLPEVVSAAGLLETPSPR